MFEPKRKVTELPVNQVDNLTIVLLQDSGSKLSSSEIQSLPSNAREANDPKSGSHCTTNPITHHM